MKIIEYMDKEALIRIMKNYRTIRLKKLQQLGQALAIILPKNWVDSLNWTRNTHLICAYHPEEEKIILIEDKTEKEYEPKFSTAKSLLKHSGKWKGTKEEYERTLKYIKENRTDAEF